jgi:hypothetical protein
MYEAKKFWKKRNEDSVLLLNPFTMIRKWHQDVLAGKIPPAFFEWSVGEKEVPNEILAFKFLREQAMNFSNHGNFTGAVASKYLATNSFLQNVFGNELYSRFCKTSENSHIFTEVQKT